MRNGDRCAGRLDLARRPARRHLRVHAGTTRVGDLGRAAARHRSRPRPCAPAPLRPRVPAVDAVATLSIHPVAEYDIAAGLALIKAAGGVTLDAEGREVVLAGNSTARLSGCFAGAPQAAQQLSWFD